MRLSADEAMTNRDAFRFAMRAKSQSATRATTNSNDIVGHATSMRYHR